MKKWMAFALLAVFLWAIFARKQTEEENHYMDLNAEIIEIDAGNHAIYVKDADETGEAVFGERCMVDCRRAISNDRILYVDYEAEHQVRCLGFEDLQIGDSVILRLNEREREHAKQGATAAEYIQLGPKG